MRTRLGVVSYLNTRPLVYAFETGKLAHSFDLLYDVPSRCAERLHSGETDVALIPSVEIARGREPYSIAPGVGLASAGPVRSVFLVLKTEPEAVQLLALDSSSRTSVALCRVVLEKAYRSRPKVFQSPPDLEDMLGRADAALLIGDPALGLDQTSYRVLDLGAAWTKLTGLPFVYACWTGREGALREPETRNLIEARKVGLRHIREIAETYAETHDLPPAFYEGYLTENMKYGLGEAEVEGLRRFYAYAFELGLIERIPEVRFYPV